MSADGSEQRALVDLDRRVSPAAWSPDGSWIAVYNPGSQIVTMDREGAGLRVIVEIDRDGRLRAVQPTQPEATTVPGTGSPTPVPAEPTTTPPGSGQG